MRTRRSLNLDRMLHGRRQRSNHSHRTPGCPPVSPRVYQTEWSPCHNSSPISSAKPESGGPHAGLCPVGQAQGALGQPHSHRGHPLPPAGPRGDPWSLACRPPWLCSPEATRPPEAQAGQHSPSHSPAMPGPRPRSLSSESPVLPRRWLPPWGVIHPCKRYWRQSADGWSSGSSPGDCGGGGGGARRLCRLPPAGPLPSCTLLLVPTQAPPSRAALPPSTPAQWDSRREPRGPQHPARRRPLGTRRPRQHTALALFQHTDVHAHVTSH